MTHTLRPVGVQRAQVKPVFEAGEMRRAADADLGLQRQALHAQIGQGRPSAGTVEAALRRQAAGRAPVTPPMRAPSTPADWVQAARLEVQRVADPAAPEQTRWLSGAERERHLTTLRGVGRGLAQGFRADRGPAVQRYAEFRYEGTAGISH